MSSNYDLYRDYIHDNFGPDDADDDCAIECYDCEIILPAQPSGFVKVRDRVIASDQHGPIEWSWVDEPYWDCPKCGRSYSLQEVSQ